jgi:hypothetical protein
MEGGVNDSDAGRKKESVSFHHHYLGLLEFETNTSLLHFQLKHSY